MIKFVSVKETDHITAQYDTKLNELTVSIDAKKKERGIEDRPAQKRAYRKSRSRRNSESKGAKEVSLEDQLQAVLTQVK